jgi:hypothetical protein
MNKKVARGKEGHLEVGGTLPSSISAGVSEEHEDMSSSEDDVAVHHIDTSPRGGQSSSNSLRRSLGRESEGGGGGGKKKPRIPWDRNALGDKNGLKFALLSVVNDNNFHIDGKFMENFREVSRLLSQEGSKFEKYEGIEPSGAQRKFNAIIRDVANHYKIKENGDFENEETADGFIALAIKMLKDIINREKLKAGYLANKPQLRPSDINNMLNHHQGGSGGGDDMDLNTSHMTTDDHEDGGNTGAEGGNGSVLSSSFLKKRKAEMTPLKHHLKRVATAGVTPGGSVINNADVDDEEEGIYDRGINRLDGETHNRVISELEKLNIRTVGDLFKAADLSSEGIDSFLSKTQVKLTKPVDRLLKLYEEVAVAKNFVMKMQSLCGLAAGDALELETYIKPFYMNSSNI